MAIPALLAMAGGALLTGGISVAAFGPGFGDFLSRTMHAAFEARLASGADLIRALRRGEIDKKQYYLWMSENGFNREQADLMFQSNFDELNVQETMTLWFRFRMNPGNTYGINKKWLDERLSNAGVDPQFADQIVEANRPLPTLDDIIRFAVRDVFEPEQVALAGLDEGLPPRFVEEASRRGLNLEDTKMYWAAHWALPGIHQVYEMLHRLYDVGDPSLRFTEKEMDTFFNLADIAPGFRERLKAISYRPLTRVDVRRIYRLGVWGKGAQADQQVYRAYRELGYNDKNAKLMTEFTKAFEGQDDRELTKAEVLKFYREGLFKEDGRDKAKESLVSLGYSDEVASRLLDFEDLQIVDFEEQSRINEIATKYRNGEIESLASLHDALAKVGLSNSEVNRQIQLISRGITDGQKRVSPATARSFYKAGLIKEKEYRQILEANGHIKIDIDHMIKLAKQPADGEVTTPSKADILGWAQSGIIDAEEFITLFKELGYTGENIYRYALQAQLPLDDKQISELGVKT